jgi:NAD+-dependent protein deacetylase sirtuin 6
MSAGYASRLSEYPNKGKCGLPEQPDTQRAYRNKLQQLIQLIQESKHTVIITGAGISTSAGIPDFRGPNGIWTIEQQQQQQRQQKRKKTQKASKKRPQKKDPVNTCSGTVNLEDAGSKAQPTTNAISSNSSSSSNTTNAEDAESKERPSMNFATAKPTLTHRIITQLVQPERNVIQFVITQNVDGLHRRSGLSRNIHAVVHGCAFTEQCEDCGMEYFRDDDVNGMSFQYTGRTCVCHGKLRDTLLDWEDPLPEEDFVRAENHCQKADLILCLGTSLRIQPVNQLPLMAKQFVIVNLQVTPLDQEATLIVRERVDTVMADVYNGLGYDINRDIIASEIIPNIERTWRMPTNNEQQKSTINEAAPIQKRKRKNDKTSTASIVGKFVYDHESKTTTT